MKNKNQQPKPPTLAELLDTKDRRKQAERVAKLFSPVIDIIVRFDGRSGQISMLALGGELSGADARLILNKAQEQLMQEEAQAMAQQEAANESPEVDLPADLGVAA